MNARSLVNKTEEFQIFAVETWLKPCVLNCELLPGLDFTIHRRDRSSQVGGGILLAVNNMIKSFQCKDLEGNAEIIACELRPNSQRKILAIVFYRPLDTNSNYKKTYAVRQMPILTSFYFVAISGDEIHNDLAKLFKDYYMWQMVDFPTRGINIYMKRGF